MNLPVRDLECPVLHFNSPSRRSRGTKQGRVQMQIPVLMNYVHRHAMTSAPLPQPSARSDAVGGGTRLLVHGTCD